MKAFCTSLPEDRILHGHNYDLDTLLKKNEEKRTYTIASTGAKLTYEHAVNVLTRYASSLVWVFPWDSIRTGANKKAKKQQEHELSPLVHYVLLTVDKSFVCEVILPEKSPIRGVIGGPAASKITAKQSAAFDTCLLLRKNNLLDDHFRSIYQKRLPAMRNAKLAIAPKKTNNYAMICKPAMWAQSQGTIPSVLYGAIIEFVPSEPLSRKHGSLMLLTRVKIPSIPPFSIFLDDGIETSVRTTCMTESLSVSSEGLESLSQFALAVFQDLFHKTFEPEPEKFPYWLAPICAGGKDTSHNAAPSTLIDWEAIAFTQENRDWRWSADMDEGVLLDRLLYDPWDGRKRYFPIAVDHSLRPSDRPPPYAPSRKWMGNILEYTLSLSKNSRQRFMDCCDWNQPVLQVESGCLRRNFLDRASDAEKGQSSKCAVCPQPLVISSVRHAF